MRILIAIYFMLGLTFCLAQNENRLISILNQSDQFEYLGEGIYSIYKEDVGYSMVDSTGRIISGPYYGKITSINGDLFIVKNDHDVSGLIDKMSKIIIPLEYFSFSNEDVSEGLISIGKYIEVPGALVPSYGAIDLSRNIIIPFNPEFRSVGGFHEGLAKFEDSKTDKYGFINTKGEIVVHPKYYRVGDFHEGLA